MKALVAHSVVVDQILSSHVDQRKATTLPLQAEFAEKQDL
jgi:hypothetical protein